MTGDTHVSITRTARLAGGLYLALLPFGIFSFVYVPTVLFVRGDVVATSRNILASEWLFRAGTLSHILSQIIVVFVAFAFYRLLAHVSREQAIVMVVMALICIPISVVTEVHNLAALRLLREGGTNSLTSGQLNAQTLLLLDMRQSGVLLAQIFWGLWLVSLGTLVYKSRFLPKVLGIGVLIAAFGYLFDSTAHLLSPGRAAISPFTAVGELLLPLWLLMRGAR